MDVRIPEFQEAPLKMTSLRAPEGLFDKAREELGYSSNQDMIVSLVELALMQQLQRRMLQDLANDPDSPYVALRDPEFRKEAQR